MERIGRKVSSYEDMNETDIQEALSMTPEERLHSLSRLKQQYMDFHNVTEHDFDSHLRQSDVVKQPVPWS